MSNLKNFFCYFFILGEHEGVKVDFLNFLAAAAKIGRRWFTSNMFNKCVFFLRLSFWFLILTNCFLNFRQTQAIIRLVFDTSDKSLLGNLSEVPIWETLTWVNFSCFFYEYLLKICIFLVWIYRLPTRLRDAVLIRIGRARRWILTHWFRNRLSIIYFTMQLFSKKSKCLHLLFFLIDFFKYLINVLFLETIQVLVTIDCRWFTCRVRGRVDAINR